ncbi:MSS4 [Candida jiufengensis]|uniref:MSS4 n=1 Tax=Candida jiufengensis TaxID=497108 RepID=UPI0022242040|nr:MSS4 [Candida jiufengensis]KAI5953260.1 MSS4 [Candida jiufengensis]
MIQLSTTSQIDSTEKGSSKTNLLNSSPTLNPIKTNLSPNSISTSSLTNGNDKSILNEELTSGITYLNQKPKKSSIKSSLTYANGLVLNDYNNKDDNYSYQNSLNHQIHQNYHNPDDSLSIYNNNSAQSTINYSQSTTTNETVKLPLLTSKNLKQQEDNHLLNQSNSLSSSKSNDQYPILHSHAIKNASSNNLQLENHNQLHSPHKLINNENQNNNSPSTPTSFKGSRSEVSDLSHDTTPSSIDNLDDELESNTQPTIINSRIIDTPSGEHPQFQFQLQFHTNDFNNKSDSTNIKPSRVSLDNDIGPLQSEPNFIQSSTTSNEINNNDNSTIKNSPPQFDNNKFYSQQQKEPQPIQSNSQNQNQSSNLSRSNLTNVENEQKDQPSKPNIVTNVSLDKPITSRRHTSPAPIQKRSSTSSQISNNNNKTTKFSIDASTNLSRKSLNLERPQQSKTFPAPTKKPSTTHHDTLFNKKHHHKRQKYNMMDDDKVVIGNKISEGHANFVMAYNMLTGIRVAVSRLSGVMRQLNDEDFKNYQKLNFNFEGSELTPSSKFDFKFKDYCPEVFKDLRNIFGINQADYLISITAKVILSELGSPGKSGSFFYYSRDFRFIIKTIHHSEHRRLMKMLKPYYLHVKNNPNSLLSQFYGLHRIKMSMFGRKSKKVHFIVMNNIFPPHRGIHLKYDLKGSTCGRITKVSPEDLEKHDLSKYTLKDLNWLENKEKIKFGPDKRKLFLDQLKKDVEFLKKVNVMDYSLLLGIHDVKKGNYDDLGTKLSVYEPKSTDKSAIINTNPRDLDRSQDLPTDVFPGRSKYIFYGHDGGIRATNIENLPLGEIYYLSIIDFLTDYSLKKRLETFFKSFAYPKDTISAIPSKPYGDRFLKFIKDAIATEKQKQS